MRAGDLRHSLDVQSRNQTQDAFGAQVVAFTTVASGVRAAINPVSGRELAVFGARFTDISHSITVRYEALWADPRTNATYRLLFGTRIFDVHASLNVDERNREVTLICTEGMSDGR